MSEETTVVERNFEQEAQKQGWKPKEDFTANGGNESDWVDAKTFVERGESSAGILKSRLEKMERRLNHQEEVNRSLASHHQRMLDKEKQQRAQLMHELEEARAQAVATGDSNAFKQADRQLNELREQSREPTKEVVPEGPNPEIEGWLEDNAWYNEDESLRYMADGYAERLRARNPQLKGRAFLDKVSDYVKQNSSKKPMRTQSQSAEGEGDKLPTREVKSSSSGNKRTYENLPPEAKKECNRLLREIKGFTKEQFCDYYDWE